MQVIYKYPLPISDFIEVKMPEGAKILSIQVQNNIPTLWALVNEDAPTKRRGFMMFGTGHKFEDTYNQLHFIATIQMGVLVWHIFEMI